MLKEFVEKILDLERTEITYISDRAYSNKPMHPVFEPLPSPLGVHSLTAIKDYLSDNPDSLILSQLILHVESETKVVLMSSLEPPFFQRSTYMIATYQNRFKCGDYIPVENFIIDLNTMFLPSETVSELIRLVGNLTDDKATQFNDDGISQKVTAKVGITTVENVRVPSPVTLTPFRTFPEIDQPKSTFLFRIKASHIGPTCALIVADGDYWKAAAVAAIKLWLTTNVPGVKILA